MIDVTPEFEALITANIARLRDIAVRHTKRLPPHEFDRVLELAISSTFVFMSEGFDPRKVTLAAVFEERVESAVEYVRSVPSAAPVKVRKEKTLEEIVREARRYRPIGSDE